MPKTILGIIGVQFFAEKIELQVFTKSSRSYRQGACINTLRMGALIAIKYSAGVLPMYSLQYILEASVCKWPGQSCKLLKFKILQKKIELQLFSDSLWPQLHGTFIDVLQSAAVAANEYSASVYFIVHNRFNRAQLIDAVVMPV